MVTSASQLSPSRFLKQYAGRITSESTTDGCILDIPCGMGRNALYLAERGAEVHCIDIDADQLYKLQGFATGLSLSHRLTFQQIDLLTDAASIECKAVTCIVNIDWPQPELLGLFDKLLKPGGFLIVETFEDRGENWRSLPRAGWYKKKLKTKFSFEHYDERKAGPANVDAVTLKMFAIKRAL
jgi:SAM-dependent methyltransferase